MNFSKAAAMLLPALALASPIAQQDLTDEASGYVDGVLRITTFDTEWHTPTANDLAVMAANGSYASDEAGYPLSEATGGVEKRQSGVYRTNTFLVGDGNPHQNPFQQQQTATLPCGNGGGCSVSIGKSHSISWTASANAAYGWISGGFSVSESYTTSQTLTCNGNAGGSVCIWYSYGVTAYTVSSTNCYYFNGRPSMCRNLGQRTLFSPNNCQPAQPYCVRGSACRGDNQGYYVKDNAPAGGPPC